MLVNEWRSWGGEAIKAHAVIMLEHIIIPQFQPHYKHIHCCLRPFQGRACVVRTHRQRWWWLVMLSRLWLTADTHKQTLTHNHTTTNSDPFFSCHTCTLISPAHTDTQPDTHLKLFQQKYRVYFQGAHRLLKGKSMPDLLVFETRTKPTVVFCLSVNNSIGTTLNTFS